VEVLVALLHLEDAVLARAVSRRLRLLKKLAAFTVDSVWQNAANAVKDEAVFTQEGLGGHTRG
jgi:hypothetical protein